MAVILQTPRLILREFTIEDVEPFFLLCSHPEVLRWTGDPGVRDLDEARIGLLTRPIADYAKHGFGRWACIDRASGKLIGFSGLKYLDELREVDLGYRFLAPWWGCGLATEAGRAVCDYGFATLGLKRILGLVQPGHVRSIRVLDKLSFNLEGEIDYRGSRVLAYARSAP